MLLLQVYFVQFVLVNQGFDMDRSTPATQIDGGNGN